VTRNGLGNGAIVECDPFIFHVRALGPGFPIVIVDVVPFATLKFEFSFVATEVETDSRQHDGVLVTSFAGIILDASSVIVKEVPVDAATKRKVKAAGVKGRHDDVIMSEGGQISMRRSQKGYASQTLIGL